jgi:hypothetical protein
MALPELDGHGPQLGITQGSEVFFDRVDLMGNPLELAQELALASAKDTIYDDWHFWSRSSRIG